MAASVNCCPDEQVYGPRDEFGIKKFKLASSAAPQCSFVLCNQSTKRADPETTQRPIT
jgi:hypothetical protein